MRSKGLTVRGACAGALLGLVVSASSCASSQADGKVSVVGPRQAVRLIESGSYVVLDLRSTRAFEAGHVEGARSAPYLDGGFEKELLDLDPEQRYLLYSRGEDVADRAADTMVALGFEHVVDAGSFGLLALAGAEVE